MRCDDEVALATLSGDTADPQHLLFRALEKNVGGRDLRMSHEEMVALDGYRPSELATAPEAPENCVPAGCR
jgi:hypothetical protein